MNRVKKIKAAEVEREGMEKKRRERGEESKGGE